MTDGSETDKAFTADIVVTDGLWGFEERSYSS